MRHCVLALALLSQPAKADLQIVPTGCPEAAVSCFTLTDLSASPGQPVIVDPSLVVAGVGRGPTGARDSLVVVDIDLSGQGRLVGVTVLDATATERLGRIEIAPDGRTFALFTRDERDHLNRNRLVGAIQFFDEGGTRQGRVASPYLADWPVDAEWSPVDLMAAYAGTQALTFRDGAMALRFGPYLLQAGLVDGQMHLAGSGAAGADADLGALVNRMFDPLGGEGLALRPGLTAHHSFPADGRPAALYLSAPPLSDPPDVRGHLDLAPVPLEPNAADYSRDYGAIALSPDGTRLAVIRLTDASCDPDPVPYDLVVYDTATARPIWSQTATRSGIVQQTLAFTRDNRLVLTEARGAVDPPCGPDDGTAPAIAVIVYNPGV